jgi:hypothetical protein
MPVACGNTVLTGDSGSVAFTPAGTSVCLLDYTDFPTADPGLIQLPAGHGFLVGDVVQFSIEGGATLTDGLTADTDYHILSIDSSTAKASVSASAGGTAVAFTNSLSEDTEGGHINMKLTEFTSVCNVVSFDFSLDREQIETTSLSCGCSTDGTGLASFKTYQAGFIDGTGSVEVQFTSDQGSMASRVIGSSLKKDQLGAQVRLYINTVCKPDGTLDNDASAYIEAPVTLLGFSFSVSPADVTTATIQFSLAGQPTAFSI